MGHILNLSSFAVLLVRVLLGILFLFQGYEKIFKFKISGVESVYKSDLIKRGIPAFLIRPSIIISSWIEFVCGILLIPGLFTSYALMLLGLNLIGAAVAFSVVRAMWDMQYFFPRFLFLVFLLIVPSASDIYSLDNLFCLK
ncbi:MAG: DoxX family protein [Bacteroidetes bacterium]|nr:DoxX family protein [Bacteroidota bacterium]